MNTISPTPVTPSHLTPNLHTKASILEYNLFGSVIRPERLDCQYTELVLYWHIGEKQTLLLRVHDAGYSATLMGISLLHRNSFFATFSSK